MIHRRDVARRTDGSPSPALRPPNSWALALPAGVFALLALVKVLSLSRWLVRAEMTWLDLPKFWALAAGNPPSRAFSAAEVVVLRQSTFALFYLTGSLIPIVAYLAARRRARAEAALIAYCVQLEQTGRADVGSASK